MSTPLVWGHSPVMMVERDGEQMGALTYAFSNTKLSSLSRLRFGVSIIRVAVTGHRVGPLLVREYEEEVWSFWHGVVLEIGAVNSAAPAFILRGLQTNGQPA